MTPPSTIGERCLALFVLGLLVFNPPLLSLFSVDRVIGGIPVLYVYLFVAWGALVVLLALNSTGDLRKRRGLRLARHRKGRDG